ncbi:substrate-binding domain-containing protein [Conexibacter stalactiti]|uniref:Substrate-binding domain-containing protein n=1 Tax=Conexibacter stalactiti TaxID=1940611 RepID=A0ABU4HKE7_9ACTN|nr:substrate-binding domain-containing protein [Conexibacter stalactiti]MDW5593769.1 substrate-binding domain-containing protein [Conexibacter stalactiti]MEC5034411.1 substrate-binding domain-containing protein [Conexibacter stalactiti]
MAASLAAAVTFTACGSSDDADGGTAAATSATATTTTASGGAGLAAVEAKVAELRKPPRPIDVPALGRRPPSGRSAVWIGCKYPECAAVAGALTPALKSLGWRLTTLTPDVTPEAIAAAWTQAVAEKPGVIFAIDVVPVAAIAAQLEQAEKDGIKVITTGGPTQVGDQGVDAAIGSVPFHQANATAMTDWAIADSQGKGKIVLLYDPSIPLQQSVLEAVEQAAAQCPDCTLDTLRVQLAEAGKTIPGQVVSYIQSHPDVNYVITTGSGALGIGQALKSAGLTDVKLASSFSQQQNLQLVKDGVEAAAIPNEGVSLGWRMADAAARLEAGETVPEALAAPVGQRQLFDGDNIGEADVSRQWDVPDTAATFERAWLVQ